MKLKLFSAALALSALGLATTGAYAQTPVPATPAPAPTELVYLQQLPSVATLMNAAKAQGTTVVSVDQTSTAITVVYRESNGQTTTVSYQILPAGEVAGAAPVGTPAPGATTVVYQAQAQAPAYYYAPYPYYGGYYPWGGWYAPIGIGIGFGFHGGGGGWRR